MNIILFDDTDRINLLPLSYTRPVAEIRTGIMTIKEKWEIYMGKSSFLTQNYLKQKFPAIIHNTNLLINGGIIPNKQLVEEIKQLKEGSFLTQGETIIAGILSGNDISSFEPEIEKIFNNIRTKTEFTKICYPWDIFTYNGQEIKSDFELLTTGKISQKLSSSNNFVQEERIFVEEGAKVEFATLNPSDGYIYIGKNAEIMEGALVRGSLALCEQSVLKMGAKIYGPTTIGPYSKVGGEVNNSVIFGYTNKAHDGFLGNSVLGEWCNLGADTNNSNLKNNYAPVRVWNYKQNRFMHTELQFCGLIMGDHSKSAINTMFNTGTVVGVCSNIFGSGFPRNFIPSFSWGGDKGFVTYTTEKAFETAEIVYARRNLEFDKPEKEIFAYIFNETKKYRDK